MYVTYQDIRFIEAPLANTFMNRLDKHWKDVGVYS